MNALLLIVDSYIDIDFSSNILSFMYFDSLVIVWVAIDLPFNKALVQSTTKFVSILIELTNIG